MKTDYVEATIQHQEDLRDARNFVKQILGYDNDHRTISPIEYTYTENSDSGYPEIILNQRFSLNTNLVHFQLIERPTIVEYNLDEILKKLFFQNYHGERHKNPEVSGLNFIDGVHNLAEKLKNSLIATRRPPVQQSGTRRILFDMSPSAYVWSPQENKFVKISVMTYSEGREAKIEKLVDAL